MIAFVLRELGHDPAWIIGGVVPQLGGNAGTGAGRLVVEGDESDRSIGLLRPEIAVVTNVEVDHHAAFASEAELQAFFDEWTAQVPHVVRGWRARAGLVRPRGAGRAQPPERGGGARRARARGSRRGTTRRASLAGFTGVDRRFQLVGARGGVSVYDDYGHNPTEIAATLRTARERAERSLIAVYQPHVHERTRHLHRELGEALGIADAAIVTAVLGERDAPIPGVTGKLVLDSVPRGVRRGWAPTLDDAARIALAWARPGDVVVTLGVGRAVEGRARDRRGPAGVSA